MPKGTHFRVAKETLLKLAKSERSHKRGIQAKRKLAPSTPDR